MKNIIVTIDFYDNYRVLLEQAKIYAQALASKIWLIHIAAPEPDFIGYQTGPQTERDHVANRLREEHRKLQTMAEDLRHQGIETTALLIQGATVNTILEQTQKLAADLIIVGSHRRTGLSKILQGSVSQSILDHAPCPVLVVPHDVNQGRE
ncbi:MAG TPA: universal stress protein [Cyanothece sp. UBA12306]|nr:universal stress protein [Cyanothece sp. UBA12306]